MHKLLCDITVNEGVLGVWTAKWYDEHAAE